MSSLTINTAIACLAIGDVQRRVYFQDSEDYIRESHGSWTGGTINNRLFHAKPNTLAAISWGSEPRIRIYYVDNKNILQEHSWDGSSWYTGALGRSNIRVDYRSKLAACTWSAITCGTTLPNAQLGSSLAAIQFQKMVRIFYRTRDNTIHEHCWDGSWLAGHTLGNGGTAIGAIAWSYDQIRVCYEQPNGNGGIIQQDYQPRDGWNRHAPITITSTLPNTFATTTNAVSNEIQEFGWNPDDGLFIGPKSRPDNYFVYFMDITGRECGRMIRRKALLGKVDMFSAVAEFRPFFRN
ncbi:fungal fucose-specific lectin-domain-containing protein [Terfezia claveryi]|nr:fungal fucose-specific lectin-domain-containing protein [Terfezia claveryi]